MSEDYIEDLKKELNLIFEEGLIAVEKEWTTQVRLKFYRFLFNLLSRRSNKKRHRNFLEVVKRSSEKFVPLVREFTYKGVPIIDMPTELSLVVTDYTVKKIVEFCADALSVQDEYSIYRGEQVARAIFYRDL